MDSGTVPAPMVVRVGLIGAGKMGVAHFAIANSHPDVMFVAVCDTTGFVLSLLKKHAGVETYKDYREMMDFARLDAVIIATPTPTHFACVRYALDKNLHVFVERPLTLSPNESRALSEMAIQRKVVNQVGFSARFIGTFLEARRLVRAGAIGTVSQLRGTAFGHVVTREQGMTWRSKKAEGGGCLHDYGVQIIDLMNFVVGPPTKVTGAKLQSIFSKDVEDAVYAILHYPNGSTGVVETNWSDESMHETTTTLAVMGTKGKITVDRRELELHLNEGAAFEDYHAGWNVRGMTRLTKPVRYYLRGEEFSAQIDAFIDAIKSANTAHEPSFASAHETDHIVDLIIQSNQAKA